MCEGDGMEEWKEYVLSELIDEISMGPFGSNIKVECFTDSGVPVLNGSNLVGLKLNEDKFNYVTEEKAASLGKANAYRNDIVITHRGTLGQIVYIPQNSKYDHYVISQSQFRIRCNQKVLPEYLVYYFHTRIGQHQLLSNASQVGVPALARPTTTFQKLRVVLPPLPTQQRIATILSSLDEKIELNNKINTNLEQQAQALFKNWFVDFEPFGGKMPEGWKVGKLSDISILSAGGDKPKEVSDKITEDYKVPIYSNGLDNFGLYGYTNKAKIFEESVTVSARGTIGFVCLRMVPYVPIVRLISLIPKTDFVSAKYLYLHLLNCNITGTGTTQQQLTVPAFSKEQIIIPSKNAIDSFTNTVNPFFETIVHNRKENEKLSSMRDTLLPKLMNGEIKVDEVRK